MRPRFFLPAAVVVSVMGGCAQILGADEFIFPNGLSSGSADADADATAADVGTSVDSGADTRTDALSTIDAEASAPEVLFTESFQTACSWAGNEGDTSFAATGATGTGGACKLCKNGTDEEFVMERIITNPRVGTYQITAFVRRERGTTPTQYLIRLEIHEKGGKQTDIPTEGVLDNGYQKIVGAKATTTAETETLLLAIGAPLGTGNECMFIDEIVVTFTPP